MDSSGFEHVFVGEVRALLLSLLVSTIKICTCSINNCITDIMYQVKNGQVSGFHNWIMFWLEEKKGNVDYRGYIKPKSNYSNAETNDDDFVLTLQFSWNGVEKFVGTSFIGVSPEFELALYTMAFLAGE